MPASFAQILSQVENFEDYYFTTLAAKLSTPPATTSGAVQFVSLAPAQGTQRARSESTENALLADDKKQFPVVVAVGINYHQTNVGVTPFKRYLPSIIDFDILKNMCPAFDYALSARSRNAVDWVAFLNGQDRHASQVPQLSEYILVATNLSPFITTSRWSDISNPTPLLSAWPYKLHLKPLFRLIGQWVDLWIGHWPDEWDTFRRWREECFIDQWMLPII